MARSQGINAPQETVGALELGSGVNPACSVGSAATQVL